MKMAMERLSGERERAREHDEAAHSFRFQIASLIRTILMTFLDFIYGFRGASPKCINVRDTHGNSSRLFSVVDAPIWFIRNVQLSCTWFSNHAASAALGIFRWICHILKGLNLLTVPTQADNLFRFRNLFATRLDRATLFKWSMSTVDKIRFSFRCVRRTCDLVSK